MGERTYVGLFQSSFSTGKASSGQQATKSLSRGGVNAL